MMGAQNIAKSIKDPIFLVGCPRSGTTLLQQMLDAHPDVAIAPETFFIRNFWLRRDQYGDLSQDKNYCQLIEDIIALPEFQEMGLDANAYRAVSMSCIRDYSHIFQKLLEQFAYKQKVNIVGEKTPNHLLYMKILQDFFPDARFIHIVRDPRAVVNSWRAVPWTTGSPTGDAEVWRRYMAKVRTSRDSVQSSLFTINYERLITSPEETLKTLCQFLYLDFDPVMLTYHHRKAQTVNSEREPWKANAKNKVSQDSLNRWCTELSPINIAKIEAVVWSEMKYFGYLPSTSSLQLLLISMLIRPKFYFRDLKYHLSQNIKHSINKVRKWKLPICT